MAKKIISGVKITKLKVIKDPRGFIFRMIRKNDKIFKQFGEIYFSGFKPGKKKGWNLHKKMSINLVCIKGKIKVVLYDYRPRSDTFKQVNKFVLSRKKYFLITIPPNIWCGYKNLSSKESILVNCSTMVYSSKEILKKSYKEKSIFYKL